MMKYILALLVVTVGVQCTEPTFPVQFYATGDAGNDYPDLGVWFSNNKGKFAALGVQGGDENFPEFVVVCALPEVDTCQGFQCIAADDCSPYTTMKIIVDEGVARFVFSGARKQTVWWYEGNAGAGFQIDKEALRGPWIGDTPAVGVEPRDSELVFSISMSDAQQYTVNMEFGKGKYGAVGFREEPHHSRPGYVVACAAGAESCADFLCKDGFECRAPPNSLIVKSSSTDLGVASCDVKMGSGVSFVEGDILAIATHLGDFNAHKESTVKVDKVRDVAWLPGFEEVMRKKKSPLYPGSFVKECTPQVFLFALVVLSLVLGY